MIRFENVSKKFGLITALSGASFSLDEGEFVFLIGPSGSGKTTIIKLILKEFVPTEGKIVVNEEDLKKIKSGKIWRFRREIGTVFQDFKLITDRTVFENVILPLEIRKEDRKKSLQQAEEILKMVGLWERKDLFPAQLAIGEIQRVSLARAVISKPKLLLADEPTGNLDPVNSEQLIKLFKEINKNGTTVLMATHNANIVDFSEERVICLSEGKVISDEKKGKYVLKAVSPKAEENQEPEATKASAKPKSSSHKEAKKKQKKLDSQESPD